MSILSLAIQISKAQSSVEVEQLMSAPASNNSLTLSKELQTALLRASIRMGTTSPKLFSCTPHVVEFGFPPYFKRSSNILYDGREKRDAIIIGFSPKYLTESS